MAIDRRDLPYRPCVGILLLNPARQVWIGRRFGMPGAWQMPQGGIDAGEDPTTAAQRELREEIGTGAAEPLAVSSRWHRYDLPDHLLGLVWGGRYRGQKQRWVAMRFTGRDADIDVAAHQPAEFDAWRWAPADEVIDLIVPFKRDVYRAVLEEFSDLLPGR